MKRDDQPQQSADVGPMVNDILIDCSSNERLRIIVMGGDHFWVMSLDDQKAWPHRMSGTPMQAIASGEFSRFVPPEGESVRLTPSKAAYAKGLYGRFKDVLSDVSKLLTRASRHELFQATQDVASNTYYMVVRRFLQNGMSEISLAGPPRKTRGERPDTSERSVRKLTLASALAGVRRQCEKLMSSPPEEEDRRDHTRAGLPRQRSQVRVQRAFRVDINALRIFLHWYDKKLKPGAKSLPVLYDKMLEEHFSVPQPVGPPQRFPDVAVPSFKVFEARYYQLTRFDKRRSAVKGAHDFQLNGRSKLSKQITKAYAAGDEGMIDATVWNVMVVTEKDRVPCGPPVVFRIRDTNSGLPLGLGVSLESASWMGAASAIDNCLADKVEFCAAYEIAIDADEWNVRGLPPAFKADRGETFNHRPVRFISLTGSTILNLPAARGDLKGGVESDFRTLQVSLNGKTPGALIKEHEALSGRPWRLKASMTLKEFTRVVILEELKRMKRPRQRRKLPPELLATGTSTAPMALWRTLTAKFGCALRRFDRNDVQLSLMVLAKASLTAEGIFFRGLFYVEDRLVAEQAFAHARRHGRRSLDIVHDPRCVNSIYLVGGDPEAPSGYVQCRLIDRADQRGFFDMTFREVAVLQELLVQANEARTREDQRRVAQLDQMQDDTIERGTEAVRESRINDPKSNQELWDGKGEARRRERGATTPQQAFQPALSAPPVPDRASDAPAAQALQEPGPADVNTLKGDAPVRYVSELSEFDDINQEVRDEAHHSE